MTTPNEALLPCPFCGGEVQIRREYRDNPNPGYGGETRVYFDCQCGAKGPSFGLKTMASFTEYTVKDFRENPILGAKEENLYAAYCADIDVQALTAWNNRAAIAQPEQTVAKDALQREATELSSILTGMCEGGYSNLSTLYTEDQPDGDSFVARAAEVLVLLAAIAQPEQSAAQPTAQPMGDADELSEFRFYKRLGFPYFDHGNGRKGMQKLLAEWSNESFDDSDSGYWAITLPASLPHPDGEGTVAGVVLHGYTLEKLYKKAVDHMTTIDAAKVEPAQPESKA